MYFNMAKKSFKLSGREKKRLGNIPYIVIFINMKRRK